MRRRTDGVPHCCFPRVAGDVSECVCALACFAPPDGRHAVAAVRPLRPALAEAVPVYYEAALRDGAWRLTEMKADESAK